MGSFSPVPKMTRRRPFVTTNFQLFGHYSFKNQDIFLKFSAYLHLYLINCWLTENLLQQMASCCTKMRNVYSRRPFVTTNFQLFCNNSNMSQDIFLKISPFDHHMIVLNWPKNFGPYSISLPATAHFGQNFKRL